MDNDNRKTSLLKIELFWREKKYKISVGYISLLKQPLYNNRAITPLVAGVILFGLTPPPLPP